MDYLDIELSVVDKNRVDSDRLEVLIKNEMEDCRDNYKGN